MRQITANVYVNTWTTFEQIWTHGSNTSFVTTSEGVVVVDTPYIPTDSIRWRDEIAKRGEVRFIINTEHHDDHIFGNYFFSGIVVASQGMKAALGDALETPEDMRQRIKETDPEGLHLVENYQPRPPTIAFSDRLSLYLGAHTFELIHLPGHTPGQVGVYIPQEKVVFTGDNFTNGWHPHFTDCSPLEWVESLKKIEAMDVNVVVPGHGEIGDKKAVQGFRAFIQECIDAVRKAINQGMSKEEAADRILFETEDFPPLHADTEAQRDDVRHLYEMLSQ